MYNPNDNREGPGPKSVLFILILATVTVVAALSGTIFASSHIANLPTATTTLVTYLEIDQQAKTSTPEVNSESIAAHTLQPIFLQDDFSINRGLLVWDSEKSFGGVMDGVYRMGVKGPHIVTWRVYEGLNISDFALKVNILMPQSTKLFSCGVVFRKSDGGRYLFGVNNDRSYEFIKVTASGEEITMIDWVTHYAIKDHGTNQLEVTAIGDVIELSINGEKLDTLLDDTHSTGEVGFYTSTYGGGEEIIVEFDDLLVEER